MNKTSLEEYIKDLDPIKKDLSEEDQKLQNFAKKHGGVILRNVNLTDTEKTNEFTIDALRLGSEFSYGDEVYSVASSDDSPSLKDILANSSSDLSIEVIEVCEEDEGAPGFHPFGHVLGKSRYLENEWGVSDVARTVIARCDLREKYVDNNSDHGTRYVYDKFNISIAFQQSGSSYFVELPEVSAAFSTWSRGEDWILGQYDLDRSSETSLDDENEDHVLKNYYSERWGWKFKEFTVTSIIEEASRQRDADGLIIRPNGEDPSENFDNTKVYKQEDDNKKFVAERLRHYPSELIEVHGFGFDGFGQILGKATLVEDFWQPVNLTRTLITKESQGEYDPKSQFDRNLMKIHDQFKIQVITEKELEKQRT